MTMVVVTFCLGAFTQMQLKQSYEKLRQSRRQT